ncbi:MAG: D-tyrosyl-tRNA(Tyr) deacylase [Anaerolineaceae bacterium]|nr:D-tyrosyl-tRNA(Tyr) deacylase [Anaerolineaceae bacterium]
MRAVIQRVNKGSVTIEDRIVAEIDRGMVVLVGVGPEDTEEKARKMATKVAKMRIFGDDQGKINLSLLDIAGEAIVVSQFTLYADTRKGHRPSFTKAAPPDLASPLVDKFAAFLKEEGVPTQTGEFGAYMKVGIENDGPVTIWLEN